MASRLLDAGAEVDSADTNGYTPLCIACSHGHAEVASRLLGAGAEVDHADTDGDTPLHLTCLVLQVSCTGYLGAASSSTIN